jgi:hypothetical protein
MLLRELTIRNFKLLREVKIDFQRSDGTLRPWTVLIGRNGTGKTSVLQAIALAAAGATGAGILSQDIREQLPDFRQPEAEVSIKARFDFGPVGQSRADNHPFFKRRAENDHPEGLWVELALPPGDDPVRGISWYTNEPRPDRTIGTSKDDPLVNARQEHLSLWFVTGYGLFRLMPERQVAAERPPRPSIDRLRPLFMPERLIGPNFADVLEGDIKLDFARILRRIVRAHQDLVPGIVDVETAGQGGVRSGSDLLERHRFKERLGSGEEKFPATWLAHGHQSTLAWLTDLVGQVLLEAGRAVGPEHMEGLVLIDEIDLYLHPTWQVGFIRALRETFPKLQFVATTHSPILLTGLHREEVLVLTRDPVNGDVIAEQPKHDPRLLTGSELYEYFFDIDQLYPTDLGRKLDEYSRIAANPYRTDAEDARADQLYQELCAEGIRPARSKAQRKALPGGRGPA